MSKETIDILMATYNGEKYLEEQINSILNQSYQNFRILICDDHSTDQTQVIIDAFLKKYPDKISQVFTKEKLGAKGNFSFLMQHANAPYVMFSDQDDVWLEEKIEKTFSKMKELEKAHEKEKPLLVHTDLQVVDRNLKLLGASFWKYVNLKATSFSSLNHFLLQNAVTGCTVMMNKSLCRLSFPVSKNSLMHDWWIAIVASAFGKIAVLNEPTILYRQHDSNTLGAKKFGRFKYFKGLFKKSTDPNKYRFNLQRLAQAEDFFKNYENYFNPSQKKMVQDYLSLKNSSFLKRLAIMKKHRFYMSGILRNILLLMVKW